MMMILIVMNICRIKNATDDDGATDDDEVNNIDKDEDDATIEL